MKKKGWDGREMVGRREERRGLMGRREEKMSGRGLVEMEGGEKQKSDGASREMSGRCCQ